MKKEPLSIMIVKTLLAVVIFAGVGTIIIGGGWLIWEQSVQIKPIIPTKSFKNCGELDGTERKDCYLNLAKENKDESFCEKISTIEFRSMCYTDLAILKNDSELCGRATASLASSCMEYFTKDKKSVVIYPNKDTVWKAGESYEIRWMPVSPELRVDIKLTTNNATIVVAQSQVNFFDTGNYLFTVPKNLKGKKKYQILVTYYIGKKFDSVSSEEFTIISDKLDEEEIIEIDKTPDWPIYQNEEFGFEMTFTEVWKDYEVIIYRNKEHTCIGFRRPTKGYVGVIDSSFDYVEIIHIYPTKIEEWEEDLKFKRPGRELGRKDGYAFVFMGMNGDIPEDQEEAIKDVGKIIGSFKFIEDKRNIIFSSPLENDEWEIGKTYQVRWTPTNSEKAVIRLYKSPVVSLNLEWEPSYSIPNTGNYSFIPFEWLETEEKYQFCIDRACSKEFLIVSK